MTSLKKWELAGLLFTLCAGTLLHFVYAWCGENAAAGILGAVNESTWEHLKLLFWPFVLWAGVEAAAFGRGQPALIPIKAFSALMGMGFIVVFFYTYAGILGRNYLPIDILTFAGGVCTAYWYSCRLLFSHPQPSGRALLAGNIGMAALILLFVLFTFCPPHIGLFRDPVSGGYGI